MIRCVIIDDEPHAVTKMEEFVRETPFLHWSGSFTNPLKAIHHLKEHPVDLLLLDIHMPQLSGMDLLKLVSKDTLVILTTGYSEYAIDGFEHNAVDYLLKPVTYIRFLKAVEKAYDIYNLKNQKSDTKPKIDKDFIFIKGEYKGTQIKLDYDDIDFIEGEKNYIAFHCGKIKHMMVMTMKDAELLLPSQLFIRVHNSFIIPIKKISAIEGNYILLKNNEKAQLSIPIGPAFRTAFLNRIAT